MRSTRLIDLFCGAGGAAMGYHRAGFDVTGVDIRPQKNYPFEFHQADALTFPLDGFDAIHASPPCQSYSRAFRHMADEKPMLIDDVRSRLIEAGVPWVIENVEGAPVEVASTLFGSHGVLLCGTSFGLRVERHRRFETSFPVKQPACDHAAHAMNPHNVAGRERIYAEFGRGDPERVWRKAMGVEWTDKRGGRDAVPPAYTEFIGAAMMRHLEARRA